ncbi:MAG: restriction endonuclease [Synergistaceae bacterium]|nr:restriction endonuclease [Synergistaceae bacterium]
MPMPTHSEISRAVLEALQDGKPHALEDLRAYVIRRFNITEQELTAKNAHGKPMLLERLSRVSRPLLAERLTRASRPLLLERLSRAMWLLKDEGFIVKPQYATYAITQKGLDAVLEQDDGELPEDVNADIYDEPEQEQAAPQAAETKQEPESAPVNSEVKEPEPVTEEVNQETASEPEVKEVKEVKAEEPAQDSETVTESDTETEVIGEPENLELQAEDIAAPESEPEVLEPEPEAEEVIEPQAEDIAVPESKPEILEQETEADEVIEPQAEDIAAPESEPEILEQEPQAEVIETEAEEIIEPQADFNIQAVPDGEEPETDDGIILDETDDEDKEAEAELETEIEEGTLETLGGEVNAETELDAEPTLQFEEEDAPEILPEPETETETEENVKAEEVIEEPQADEVIEPEDDDRSELSRELELELSSVFEQFNETVTLEILGSIYSLSDDGFEQFVIDLLSRMGYHAFQNARFTESNVGSGIHGLIMDDNGPMYIHAVKREPSSVIDDAEVENFDAAAKEKGGRGMFITTARFTKHAEDFADEHGMLLVDDYKVASLMMLHNFCVKRKDTFEVKAFDAKSFADYKAI